jgi:hypothetical protein
VTSLDAIELQVVVGAPDTILLQQLQRGLS